RPPRRRPRLPRRELLHQRRRPHHAARRPSPGPGRVPEGLAPARRRARPRHRPPGPRGVRPLGAGGALTAWTEDAVLGCLLGGAIGDAVGGVAERGRLGLSDDTQLTLATCEAVIEAGCFDVHGLDRTLFRSLSQ